MPSRHRILLLFLITLFQIDSILTQNESTWHGYRMLDFTHEGRSAKVVFPASVHESKPWIWRARFWGHEPQTDLALLDLGFHLVYIDVVDLYGSPKAVRIWNGFYRYLIDHYQLNRSCVLEGFSRGGLIVYNWAAENPDKVACIYADAPVCDIRSWPGGKGRSEGSPADWEKCLAAYGLDEVSAESFKGVPIYTAARVADARIPVLHVCGKADEVVPIEENTYRIEKIFGEKKALFQLIEKEGVGHHPHSLKNPAPIVRFILSHTVPGLLTEEIQSKAPRSVTYRRGLANPFFLKGDRKKAQVAFLGGSITYNGGWRDSVMLYLQRRFPRTEFTFINAGIPSMGSVPGAYRLEQDVLSKGKIDLLFVEAAVNDATNGRTAKAQIRGMEGIVRHALRDNPQMDIIMLHFADPDKLAAYNQGKTPEVIIQHEKVAEHYRITSVNLAKEVNDRILNGEFSWKNDFKDLHPSPFGQQIYAESIISTLDSLLNKTATEQHPVNIIAERPIDAFSYFNGHFISIKKSKKRRNWSIVKNWDPDDNVATRKGFVEVPVLEAVEPGSVFSLAFKGRAIGVLVAAGPDTGKLEYSIDGSYYRVIDQFTPWSGGLHLPWLYILEDELINGKHNLVLRISDKKNAASKGYACRILAFAVN